MKRVDRTSVAAVTIILGFSTTAFAVSQSKDEGQPAPSNALLAASLNNQGEALRSLGRYDEAEPLLRRSLVLTLDEFGPWHANVAAVKVNLAKVYLKQGNLDRAEALFHQAGKIYERIRGPEGPALEGTLLNLAMVHLQRREFVEAEVLGRRTLSIRRKRLGSDDVSVSSTLNTLGLIAHGQRRFKDAENYYRESLRILRVSSPEPLEEARVLGNLARLLKDQKRWDAQGTFDKALEVYRSALGADHAETRQLARDREHLGEHRSDIDRRSRSR